MSMAASPRKPWETGPSPTAALPSPLTAASGPAAPLSAVPFSSAYDPTGAPAAATASAAPDAHALVAANNNRLPNASPSSALTTATLPFDPTAQPILPAPNPYGITPSALYQPGMLPMPGMPGIYPGQPLPVGFNPITHIGSSIQSFGRFSQLLQLNFDALHMSFSSLLRLFDSYSILRAETVMLGQTFTTLNVFAWLGSKLWRLMERLRGRGGALDMEKGWTEAAGPGGVGGAAGGGVGVGAGGKGQPSFFSGWTWALLVIAVGWSVVRWIVRIVRRRILGHVDPPPQPPQPAMLPPGVPQPPQPPQPSTNPVDPNQPPSQQSAAGYPAPGVAGLGGASYGSPYQSLGYGSAGLSSSYGGYGAGGGYGGYGGGYGSGGYGSSYLGGGMGTGYGTAGYGYGGAGMSGYGGMAGMGGMGGMTGYGAGSYGMGGLGY